MGKDADSHIVIRGLSRTIEYAVCANGSMPAREFVRGLSTPDRAKLLVLFQRMADTGNVPNPQQFKHVKGKIFEFKKQQMRVFCFRTSDRWLLTNGYGKKRDRLDPNEIRRAQKIMWEHMERELKEPRGG